MNDVRGTRVFPVGHLAAAWWAVPLRVVVGYGFIVHGYSKLSRGPSGFAAILQALDVPVPDVMAWATILVELIGGVAVVLGAGRTRRSAAGSHAVNRSAGARRRKEPI